MRVGFLGTGTMMIERSYESSFALKLAHADDDVAATVEAGRS
jgi:hypothetical protein